MTQSYLLIYKQNYNYRQNFYNTLQAELPTIPQGELFSGSFVTYVYLRGSRVRQLVFTVSVTWWIHFSRRSGQFEYYKIR